MIEKHEHVFGMTQWLGRVVDWWYRGRRQRRRRGPDKVAARTPIQQTNFLCRGRAVETSPFPHDRVRSTTAVGLVIILQLHKFFYRQNSVP